MTDIDDIGQAARIARGEGWALDVLIRDVGYQPSPPKCKPKPILAPNSGVVVRMKLLWTFRK